MEKKSKHVTSAQQIGFGPTFFHKRLNFIKGIVKHNEYDLTSMMNVINKI